MLNSLQSKRRKNKLKDDTSQFKIKMQNLKSDYNKKKRKETLQ